MVKGPGGPPGSVLTNKKNEPPPTKRHLIDGQNCTSARTFMLLEI